MFKKMLVFLLLSVFLILSVIGCGSATRNMSTAAASGKADMKSEAYLGDKAPAEQVEYGVVKDEEKPQASVDGNNHSPGVGNSPINSGHKVIQTGEISIETLIYEDTVSKLTDYITSAGGYIESSSLQGNRITSPETNSSRSAQFVFRIPQSKYSQLFVDVKTFGTVVSEQSRGEDITDKYFDTEARLKSLHIQEERLLALLQKAGKMEDILAIEKELQNTRYQIENYTGTIRKWDSLVNFSTVTIRVVEVREIKPIAPNSNHSLWNRISYGFTNSLRNLWSLTQDLLVLLVAAIPFLVPIAIVCFIAYFIYKQRRNKKTITNGKEDKGQENV